MENSASFLLICSIFCSTFIIFVALKSRIGNDKRRTSTVQNKKKKKKKTNKDKRSGYGRSNVPMSNVAKRTRRISKI